MKDEVMILGGFLMLGIGVYLAFGKDRESVIYPIRTFFFEEAKSQMNEDFFRVVEKTGKKDWSIVDRPEKAGMLMVGNQKIIQMMSSYSGRVHWHLPGNRSMGDKDGLFLMLSKQLGRDSIDGIILPKTYILPSEYGQMIDNEEDTKGKLIYKSNQEAQKGLLVSDHLLNLSEISQGGFVLGQKMIPNVWSFQGHATSFRFYLAVRASDSGMEAHLYPDGIVSYSPEVGGDVASFYGSRSLYDQGFPITLKELFHQLDPKVISVISILVSGLRREMSGHNFNGNVCYELFGIDLVMDTNGKFWLIEANMGPGMRSHDKSRDAGLRSRVLANYWSWVTEGVFRGYWISV